MIRDIIDLLKADDWNDGGELIQIAKGKYKIPQSLKEYKDYFNRSK